MRKYTCLPMTALVAFSTTSWSSDQFEEEIISRNTPQLSISGSLQHSTHYTGQAHALLPLFNSEEAKSLAYGYLTGQYSPLDWSVGAGGGVRTALSDTLTIGGYGLVEHQRSEHGNRFWRFSPGLEVQGNRWHLSANAYIPIGKNEHLVNTHTFNIDYTTLEFSKFENHTGFLKTPITTTSEDRELGIRGVDLVGRWQVIGPLTLSLGGYYLPSEGQSRTGIVAGLAYQVSSGFTLEVQGHQDQEEKQIQARMSLHLGNNQNTSSGLSTRLLQRVGAEWAKPYTQVYETEKVEKLENLYFFKEGEEGTACTAEAPCGKISQVFVDQRPKNSTLLLAKDGTFEVDSTGYDENSLEYRYLTLKTQSLSLLGRSTDFTQPVAFKQRPIINKSIIVHGGSDIVISQIQIQNTPYHHQHTTGYPGLFFDSANRILVHQVKLIVKDSTSLLIQRSSNVQILNSESTMNHGEIIYSNPGDLSVWFSDNITIAHNTFSYSSTKSAISAIKISENSRGVVFKNNTVNGSGVAEVIVGIRLDNSIKEFSASRNKFTLKGEEIDITAMTNIEGKDRKAEHNSFVLTTTSNDKTVTTNEGGPSTIQLQAGGGKPHIDEWNNSFEREPIASSSAMSWLGSLFSK